jgi:hypothetical protein
MGTAMGYGVDGFDSRHGKIFLFTTVSRSVLGPTRPLTQWVPGGISARIKRPGREADHLFPSKAETENGGTTPLHKSPWYSA